VNKKLILGGGLFLNIAIQSLDARYIQQAHDSIYNTEVSSNAIYNGYNLFVEDLPVEDFKPQDDDLDVEVEIPALTSGFKNNRHNSKLENAVLQNNEKLVEQLLKNPKVFVNYRNKEGKTALHFAVDQKNTEIVRLLLAQGANPNISDNLGWTPLHIAAQVNAFTIVQLLLDVGADINSENLQGQIPADLANNHEMKNLLISING